MEFVQKIYHGDKPLVLTSSSSNYKEHHPEAVGYTVFEASGTGAEYLDQAIGSLDQVDVAGVILSGLDKVGAERLLLERYHLIYAAGGLVTNPQGAVLLIRRLDKWDLPKGKCEAGEDLRVCSMREVEEETGIQHLSIDHPICDTWHVYEMRGQATLKQTAWFRMQTSDSNIPVPQTEEHITEVRWVDPDALAAFMDDSYETIREVMRAAGYFH